MISIENLRNNTDEFRRSVRAKGIDLDVDHVLDVAQQERSLSQALDEQRRELKAASKKVGSGEISKEDAKSLSEAVKATEERHRELRSVLQGLLDRMPNVLAPEVPDGLTDEDNLEVRRWGEPRQFSFEPADHLTLLLGLGMVDVDSPRSFAGTRSYALKGAGALLEMAVLRFAVDRVMAHGFTPVVPPVMVRESALYGTGFFPGSREDTYALPEDDLYLVGTSEVGLVALHSDSIIAEADLPIRYVGTSTCFRREAGSAGRDVRGLYRVHQFNKVEQVVICRADIGEAEREHAQLLANAEEILQALELPHRVALACSGETGLGQYRKNEVETWMPSRQAYSETHSCSTLLDFQARRSKIRYKTDGGNVYAYTLNNTAAASPRILIPIVENYQNADGSVTVPTVLRPYMNGLEVIRPVAPPS